jgi:hypothetical protein
MICKRIGIASGISPEVYRGFLQLVRMEEWELVVVVVVCEGNFSE